MENHCRETQRFSCRCYRKRLERKKSRHQKEEDIAKDKGAPDSNKIAKGPKQSRWEKQFSPVFLILLKLKMVWLVALPYSISTGRLGILVMILCLFSNYAIIIKNILEQRKYTGNNRDYVLPSYCVDLFTTSFIGIS